jgi:hypothetical protein
MIEPNKSDISDEIIESLHNVQIGTLFNFNDYVRELHETVLAEIKKRGYLIIVPMKNTTEH